MRHTSYFSGVVRVGLMAAAVAACAADELDSDDWVEDYDVAEVAVAGRWVPSASVAAAANRQYARYDDAPSWSGGRNCGGSLLAGTRAVGDYLRANFRGVRSYDGYVCRANTASTSQTSMHGTGRALDIYIPLSNGAADNTLGDPVAAWLISNASALGVQLVIWDRSSWNSSRASGSKLRAYGGPHPHHDHLHVELNNDGASRRTAWFSNPGAASPPGASVPAPTPAPTPAPSPAPSPEPSPVPNPGAPRMRVNASALNLRRGPGTAHAVITSMPCGAAVAMISGPSSGWYQIDYGSTRGWASGAYLLADSSFSPSSCGR